MRIRKSVSAVVATVIVAALFSGAAGSMTVVAHAESISNKSQTATLAMQALSDRNDLAHGGDGCIAVGDREVVRWHGGIPVAEATNSHQVSTYSWTSWGGAESPFLCCAIPCTNYQPKSGLGPTKSQMFLSKQRYEKRLLLFSPWVKPGSRTTLPRRLQIGSFSS